MDKVKEVVGSLTDSADRYTNLERTEAEPTVLRPAIHELANVLNTVYGSAVEFKDATVKPQLEALKADERASDVFRFIEERPEALCYSTAGLGALSGLRGGPRRMIFRGILGAALGFACLTGL